MPAYFYEKTDLVCPACGFMLEWTTRAVFTPHGDRMGLLHPPNATLPNSEKPCPHAGKTFYAPGIELSEIPAGK